MKTRYQLLWIVVLLVGCKASSVSTTSSTYSEDLSTLRKPALQDTVIASIVDPGVQDTEAPEGDIGMELDSVLTMITGRNAANNSWDGYTIQMYSGLSREEAYNARDQARALGLELNPAIEYYQPNYRVKGGRFFDRLEAFRVYKEVKRTFPAALLLPIKMGLAPAEVD